MKYPRSRAAAQGFYDVSHSWFTVPKGHSAYFDWSKVACGQARIRAYPCLRVAALTCSLVRTLSGAG